MTRLKNVFNKGLELDFNPIQMLNQQDAMTSALNATFFTKIGNDTLLQPDLGNGRVESAYLPNGYIPLGCKEHGGIIYIVSYNPISKKGQIGSFPSPERNISSTETNSSGQRITWSEFFDIDTGLVDTYKRVYPLDLNILTYFIRVMNFYCF